MAFQVPKSKASIKQNRFEFEIDGRTFDVPLMRYLPGWQVERFSKAGESANGADSLAALFGLFGEVGTASGDAVRGLDQEQLDALTDAYLAASGVTQGESAASSDS